MSVFRLCRRRPAIRTVIRGRGKRRVGFDVSLISPPPRPLRPIPLPNRRRPPKLRGGGARPRSGGRGMSIRMALAAVLLAGTMASPAFAQDRCGGSMTLFNGKIHTMDARDQVVSQV